jgi:hypothetical protein
MKVSSPVGDFPFEARELGLEEGRLIVRGSMGAWPARVEIGLEDVPPLLRLVPAPVLAVIGVFLLGVLARLLRSGRNSNGSAS